MPRAEKMAKGDYMRQIPATASPVKMCQLRSLVLLLDQPTATPDSAVQAYRMAAIRDTLQICQCCRHTRPSQPHILTPGSMQSGRQRMTQKKVKQQRRRFGEWGLTSCLAVLILTVVVCPLNLPARSVPLELLEPIVQRPCSHHLLCFTSSIFHGASQILDIE